jgi:shikimate kinase / 3-dehydroquinate synthase
MKRNIILTGFMGTGKSTVGRLLAERLQRPFLDTDDEIVRRAGQTIADIFDNRGEAYFRGLEGELAYELSQREGVVIATGGRLMLDPANALDLGQNGLVFCLTAAPAEILARLADDPVKRPLLAVADPEAAIERLLKERETAYGRYPAIATSGQTATAVAEQIIAQLPQARPPDQNQPSRLPVRHFDGQYEVVIGRNLLPELDRWLPRRRPSLLVSDETIGPLHAPHCQGADLLAPPIFIPAGEHHKTLATVAGLYDAFLAAGLDRGGQILALGGGVVGDTVGFAAATYMRGVPFVQLPTSLLAMVDASVGGKTGVDLPQGKNLVGAFKQPTAVLADINSLITLPAAEWTAGLAEIIKHGLLAAPALLTQAAQISQPTAAADYNWPQLQSLIARAVQVKRDVVQRDPFEMGERAKLNLGHTFAHALEQATNYQIRHGEAVAIGLVAAARLSAKLGHCSPDLPEKVERWVTAVGLPAHIPNRLSPAALRQLMGRDKKKLAGRLRFVLLRDIGDVFVSDEAAETAEAMETAVLETLAEQIR